MVPDESPMKHVHIENVFFPTNVYGQSWNCNAIVDGTAVAGSVEPWPPCADFAIVEPPKETIFSSSMQLWWIIPVLRKARQILGL